MCKYTVTVQFHSHTNAQPPHRMGSGHETIVTVPYIIILVKSQSPTQQPRINIQLQTCDADVALSVLLRSRSVRHVVW